MIRKILTFFLLILISWSFGRGLYVLKDGFSPLRIQSLENWVQAGFNEEITSALKQSFHYVGRGRQCFAFASADGKYILKFLRTDIYKTPFLAKVLPLISYCKQLEKVNREREDFILNSFQLSFEELKDETAILAIHLGRSFSKELLIVKDKLGCTHRLPLKNTSFILQYKRPILMKEFSKALQAQDEDGAKKILDALLAVIVERANKGILNRDRSFLRNYGFDGQRAYQIDVGSFFKQSDLTPRAAYEKSVRDSIDPIQEWLAANAPRMLFYLEGRLAQIIPKDGEYSKN